MKKLLFLAYCMWIVPISAQSVLPAPTLKFPINGYDVGLTGEFSLCPFSWNSVEKATLYELQISRVRKGFSINVLHSRFP